MTRGEIYRFRAPRGRGHEQRGTRYGVILQTSDLVLSTVILAPTSTSARPASFRPEIVVDGVGTRVLVEQLGAVDRERLGRSHGRLAADEMDAVDRALEVVLGLGR